MKLGMLGPLEVRSDDGELYPLGGPRQRAVLVALALRVGQTVAADRLIADVWGEELPGDPPRTLATVISRLRVCLGDPGAVERTGTGYQGAGYRLTLPPETVDAHRFEQLVGRGRALLEDGDPHAARASLSEALGLWRGEPLTDLGEVPLVAWARPRLEERRLQALEARVEIDLRDGLAEQVVGELFDLVAAHPLRERFVAQLMRALASVGRRGEALAVHEETRKHLAEELGIDPSPELARIHLDILREDSLPPSRPQPRPTPSDTTPATTCLPVPPLTSTTRPFVGRTDVLERLRRAWQSVSAGDGARAVLVVGEPGVGKTRTAAHLAAEVHAKGGRVLAGRCDEEPAIPYQPFVEALDWQSTHAPDLPLGRLPGELVRLLPELGRRRDGLPPPVESEPEVEEHRLFQAVTAWVSEVSREDGLLLILDDLQWAARATVRLLAHVLRGVASDPQARVLLLATYRDTEVDGERPLAAGLGQLRRCGPVEDVPLEGLGEDEVRELIETTAGHELDDATAEVLVPTVHAETEGNPFFVGEVLRHLVETGAVAIEDGRWELSLEGPLDVPTGVRDVVTQRLSRLSKPSREVLRFASVLGRDCDIDLVAVLVDGGMTVTLDALDEAIDARLVEESGANRLHFTHALVRTTLLESLSASRRRRVHGLIADVLARLRPQDAAAIAHHALLARFDHDRREWTIEQLIRAGEQALEHRMPDDAHHWFTHALTLIDEAGDIDEPTRILASCGLGQALRDQHDPAFAGVLLEAGRRALAIGEVSLALRAATTASRLGDISGMDAPERAAFFEELLAHLDEAPAHQRAPVLAALSMELMFIPGECDRRLALADEAVDLARSTGDPRLEAAMLSSTMTSVSVPRRVREAPRRIARRLELADHTDDPSVHCLTRYHQVEVSLDLGDVAAARVHSEQARALAGPDVPPTLHWMSRAQGAQFLAYDGDLDAARAENAACLELGQALEEPDAFSFWGGVEVMLAVIDGTLPTVAEPLGSFAGAKPTQAAWRAGQAWALAEAGRGEEARLALERHGLLDPTTVPENWIQLTTFVALAGAAYELGLPDLADALLPLVEPHADLWANVVVFTLCPTELAIGLAAAATHRWDEAVRATRRAHALLADQTRSHVPWVSWHLGRVLLGRGGPDDIAEARAVVRDGLAEAQAMSMPAMTSRLGQLADDLD